MNVQPATPEAYELLQEGSIALAEVESNGIAIDVDYLERAMRKTKKKVARLVQQLEEDEVMKVWKKTYRGAFKLQSGEQLGKVLFDKMGFEAPEKTEKGKYSTDEEALSTIEHPFVQAYLEVKKLQKALNTNLRGLSREVVNGFVHCFFNLHTVQTYRSSSDSFNFQNIPVRDPNLARLIRRCFIPRPGRQLAEIDISGAEVRVATCYHRDPRMIDYILDPTKDMHRDMAMEIYCLPEREISKPIRHCGKNMFVFPEFYGDWYKDCARLLWASVDKIPLTTTSGKPLRQHLTEVGLTERGALDPDSDTEEGTFEDHLKKIEHSFWNDRFPVYSQWKRDWYEQYQRQGWFQMLTGFVCHGHMGRNEVINYPVQGAAFHCLLWALIRIVRKELKKRNMQTLVVGQIHDSMVCDVVPSELDEFLAICHKVFTVKLRRHWPWLIVPIEIEAEVAPVGGSWVDKAKYKIPA